MGTDTVVAEVEEKPDRQVRGDKNETIQLSAIISRMINGVPVIRKIETCSPGSAEMALCLTILSDDLESLKFVRDTDENGGGNIAVSSLYLGDVEQVAISNADTHAIGLFIPNQGLIMELIFASPEDWNVWFTGLTVLCSKSVIDKQNMENVESESAEWRTTEVQDTSCIITTSPTGELVALVNELQAQNENLKSMLDTYEGAVDEIKAQLEEEMKGRHHAEKEALRLKKLLMVREETITELSDLIQSLLQKQQSISSIENSAEEFFIGSERKDRKPRVINLMKPNSIRTPATTVSDTVEVPEILQSLEDQLKMLEHRKHILEAMLGQ
jgi:hypothetical protein